MRQRAKKKAKSCRQRHPTSPLEIIIRDKAKKFVEAEKEYWKERNALIQRMQPASNAFSLRAEQTLPSEIASTVYGLKDGVTFVRHKAFPGRPNVVFRALPMTLEDWSQNGLFVPIENGEISLARAGFVKGLGSFTIINCSINNIEMPCPR
jgi:hypothetical protein